MDQRDKLITALKLAEQQFRLACTVNLAVFHNEQTLDVPIVWRYGDHAVSYKDFGLRHDQALLAASLMENRSLYVLAKAIQDAIGGLIDSADNADPSVEASFQIATILRNSFAHSMIFPVWKINQKTQKDRIYEVHKVIKIDTTGLHGKSLSRQAYGGPLALFYLGRHVRCNLLNDPIDPNRVEPPFPNRPCYKVGLTTIRSVDEVLEGTHLQHFGAEEAIDLGGGHTLRRLPTKQ
jgi:hypothetical protein